MRPTPAQVNAASVARALAQAEIDGQKGHGLSRVPIYAAQARAGKVDGHATPRVRQTRPGSLMIDVADGFVFPAVDLAVATSANGRRHRHRRGRLRALASLGVVGRHVERLAEMGLLVPAFANTPKAMAPWGGRQPLFGTNPLAFAAPQRSGPPLVVDLALSQVARGEIVQPLPRRESPFPPARAVDDEGNPTTDAKVALKGALQPIGGAEGAALALMVEVLAVALTGARFSSEASSFFDAEGQPPGVGQLIIAIDADAFAGREAFLDRLGILARSIEADTGVRLPGSRRLAAREKAQLQGVAVDASLLAEVRALAR